MIAILNNKEIETVIGLTDSKRYEYFIKRAADRAFVWGLYDNGWVSAGDDKNQLFFPVWPTKEYAVLCMNTIWKNASPREIEIHEFLEDYLDEMKQANVFVAVFYTPNDKGIIIEPEQLKKDLLNELSKIE